MSTVETAPSCCSAGKKSWFARHKILTGLGLALLAIVVGGGIATYSLWRFYFHGQYAAALAEIRSNPRSVERLGAPISAVRIFPAGSVDGESLRIMFEVQGPKSSAETATVSRMFDGKWEFQTLELKFPDGTKVNLADDIHSRSGDSGTPAFDPNAKQPAAEMPDLPTDIVLPDLPPEPK